MRWLSFRECLRECFSGYFPGRIAYCCTGCFAGLLLWHGWVFVEPGEIYHGAALRVTALLIAPLLIIGHDH